MTRPPVHAVILAGGAGTRFWPLSREARPKPLLKAGGEQSLLGETLARARRVADEDDVWLVCGESHARAMRRETGLPARRVLVEPRMRNTAAAIGAVAHRIAREDPDAVMAVLSADHRIPDGRAFATAIRKAARAAARHDVLVTIGVRPRRPETGFGYIQLGPAVEGGGGLYQVARFQEKPDLRTAKRFVARGDCYWNAGIFVWRATTLLTELAACAPRIARALSPLGDAPRRELSAVLERVYRRVAASAIDTAVLERSENVWCLPVDFHWSDVGNWQSLAEEVGVSKNVTGIIQGEAWLCDAPGNLVSGADRPIVLLGVEGLAVIDAGDAILIADLERSSEVREVVARLKARGRRDLL
jgi:mannose-1-phosphate guanylyltransferase